MGTGRVNRVRAASTTAWVATVRAWLQLLRRAPAVARTPTKRITPRTAYALVLGLWAIFFGAGVINAVLVMIGERGPSSVSVGWPTAVHDGWERLASTGACVLLVVLLASHYGISRARAGWPQRNTDRHVGTPDAYRTGAVYVVVLLAMSMSMTVLQGVFGGADYPSPPPGGWAGFVNGAAGSVAAGIIEEVILVAVLVTVLEAARQPTWAIYATAVLVRVSFHLYYAGTDPAGLISVAPMIAWAAAAVALFRWTRLILPLIVVHTLWDLRLDAAMNVPPDWSDLVTFAGFLLLAGGAGGYVLMCQRRQKETALRELRPVVAATAERLGVPAPQVRGSGQPHPEVYHGRRGPVLRYDWRSVRRHTDEQRLGWVAHALAHQRLGHPLRRRGVGKAFLALLILFSAAATLYTIALQVPGLLPAGPATLARSPPESSPWQPWQWGGRTTGAKVTPAQHGSPARPTPTRQRVTTLGLPPSWRRSPPRTPTRPSPNRDADALTSCRLAPTAGPRSGRGLGSNAAGSCAGDVRW